LNTDTCKFESSQKDESRAQLADSSRKLTENLKRLVVHRLDQDDELA